MAGEREKFRKMLDASEWERGGGGVAGQVPRASDGLGRLREARSCRCAQSAGESLFL